jgi:hypothetical protein
VSTVPYTFSDAQRLTGVQRGHLARWAERGIITADLGGGGVSGAHRKFSFRNIFEIALAVELQRFRVDQVFIKQVLTELRTLDLETIRTADAIANRFREHPAQQKGRGARNRRDLIKRLDPINQVKFALESDRDNDEKRWNRFKDPDKRGDMLAFVVLELLPRPAVPGGWFPRVSFLDSLRQIEEVARPLPRIYPHEYRQAEAKGKGDRVSWGVAEGITTILIDARRLLIRLERETGDRL